MQDPNIADVPGIPGTSMYQKVNQDIGAKFILNVTGEDGDMQALATQGNILRFIEGPNEPDTGQLTYTPPRGRQVAGYEAGVKLQPVIWNYVKNVPGLANRPVLLFSLGNGPYGAQIGPVDAAYADHGNLHFYYGPTQPSNGLEQEIGYELDLVPNKPVVATETGDCDMTGDTSDGCVSQAVEAQYILTDQFDLWQAGITNIVSYELDDFQCDPNNTNVQYHYGLLNCDFTPKPAGIAYHNMTTILNDTTTPVTTMPVALPYTFSNNPPSTFNSQLFQKHNGTFVLVLWNDALLADLQTDADLTVVPIQVTLQLGREARRVEIFDPIIGTTATNTVNNVATLNVTVPPHPIFLFITP